MRNYVIWLLSYIGLGLAFTLGNHQAAIDNSHTDENRAILASTNFNSFKPTTNAEVHDWLVYDKRKRSNDDMLLLDDVLSAVLDNFYKKKQHHHSKRPIAWGMDGGGGSSNSLNLRYDKHSDKLKREGKKERTLSVAVNKPRTLFRNGKPYSSVAMYVEALAPVHTLIRPRFDRMTMNENLDLPKVRNYRISPSASYDSDATIIAATAKSLGKRSRIPSGMRKDMKESDEEKVSAATAVAAASSNMASQFILRSARGNRQYDVPQIECPLSDDGMERFACPNADRMGRYRCIDDHVLCDGFIDCPMGEDEDRQACMFYKTTKAHLDVLADALLRWARGR